MNPREEAWLVKESAFFVSCTNSGVKDLIQSQPGHCVTTTGQDLCELQSSSLQWADGESNKTLHG